MMALLETARRSRLVSRHVPALASRRLGGYLKEQISGTVSAPDARDRQGRGPRGDAASVAGQVRLRPGGGRANSTRSRPDEQMSNKEASDHTAQFVQTGGGSKTRARTSFDDLHPQAQTFADIARLPWRTRSPRKPNRILKTGVAHEDGNDRGDERPPASKALGGATFHA